MNILFLVYHGFSQESGISKKIHQQVRGLRQNGHQVHLCYYDFNKQGHRCRFVNCNIISDYGSGRLAGLFSRICYGSIYRYCRQQHVDLVYSRSFMNASPFLIHLFAKLRRRGIRCVCEIPTYPYDKEVSGYCLNDRLALLIDKLFRKRLARQMDAIVTFANVDTIFGQRTIKISNGVDFDALPLHQQPSEQDSALHFIGVAEMHYWHGFDRLVAGLGEYYQRHPDGRRIYFHVVGWEDYRGMSNLGYPTIDEVTERYGISEYIIKHGRLFGIPLNNLFDACSFAIGSLGRHRCGIDDIKTLKNREYAARGIPFIYSENDSDFDDKPYVLKAPKDESPIDIDAILLFLDNNPAPASDIRKSVEHLSWKCQMAKVLKSVVTLPTIPLNGPSIMRT